jgi:hypothetical protein
MKGYKKNINVDMISLDKMSKGVAETFIISGIL